MVSLRLLFDDLQEWQYESLLERDQYIIKESQDPHKKEVFLRWRRHCLVQFIIKTGLELQMKPHADIVLWQDATDEEFFSFCSWDECFHFSHRAWILILHRTRAYVFPWNMYGILFIVPGRAVAHLPLKLRSVINKWSHSALDYHNKVLPCTTGMQNESRTSWLSYLLNFPSSSSA